VKHPRHDRHGPTTKATTSAPCPPARPPKQVDGAPPESPTTRPVKGTTHDSVAAGVPLGMDGEHCHESKRQTSVSQWSGGGGHLYSFDPLTPASENVAMSEIT
jgi:hypothetical protein